MGDIPPALTKVIGNQQFSDVLQATKAWYSSTGDPMPGNILFTLSKLENGEYQTNIFLSSRFSLSSKLLHTWENLGAQVYRLTGVPEDAPELGHSEMAAEAYRKLMSKLPAGEQISSVDESISLRPICGTGCASAETDFVDRPGVTFQAVP
jgi:hypothetical protein